MRENTGPTIHRIGAFELDVELGRLRRGGERIPIESKPFEVLTMLVAHRGRLVGREALRQALWPGHSTIDVDKSLNTAIKKARFALGDRADEPRFIETFRGRGYRLRADPEQVIAASSTSPRRGSAPGSDTQSPWRTAPWKTAAWTAACWIAVVALALVAFRGPTDKRAAPRTGHAEMHPAAGTPAAGAPTDASTAPPSRMALRDHGRQALEQRRFALAEHYLEAAAEQFPDSPTAALDLTWLHLVRGRVRDAVVSVQGLIARFPEDPRLPLVMGFVLLHDRQFAASAALCSSAFGLPHEDLRQAAGDCAARAFARLGRYPAAIHALRVAWPEALAPASDAETPPDDRARYEQLLVRLAEERESRGALAEAALAWAGAGHDERALESLDRARESRDPEILLAAPEWDGLRASPAFGRIREALAAAEGS